MYGCVLVHAKVQRKSDEVCKIQKIKNNLSGVVQSRQSFEHKDAVKVKEIEVS